MASILGGIGIAHTPSMGYQYDKGQESGWDPKWQAWFDGTRPVHAWLEQKAPTHLIVIYNDHLNYFDLSTYPTFAIGMSDHFPQADEGYGLRPFPGIDGDPDFAWPIARSLMQAGFDLTFCQELELDHGIYSWLPYLMDPPWPIRILPIAVNMLMQPLPTPARLRQLGTALGDAVRRGDPGARVVIVGTGGMSHQIHGTRFGMTNERFDRRFLDQIESRMDELIESPPEQMMQVAGTEAIELTMWYAMRAALANGARKSYSFYTTPAVTGCGVITLDEP
ncbi:MAG TPA: protocatechuate 3,4-dioxygenase [Gammaproteobacteria bacterium]